MSTSIALAITRTPVAGSLPLGTMGYELNIVATGTGIDSNVFIYQRSPSSAGAETTDDIFYSVASIGDMALPTTNPAPHTTFFRTDTVDIILENQDSMDEVQGDIEYMLQLLCRANDQFSGGSQSISETVTVDGVTINSVGNPN